MASFNFTPSQQRPRPRPLQGQAKRKARAMPTPFELNQYMQKLNNSGAYCIEIGMFDRAIVSLTKALKISQMHEDSDNTEQSVCICPKCSLEQCISYSEQLPTSVGLLSRSEQFSTGSRMACSRRPKKRMKPPSPSASHPLFKSHFWKPEEEENGETTSLPPQPFYGSIYRRPIQVDPRLMQQYHLARPTLSVIIVFNLALAKHCALVSTNCSEDERRAKLQATLKLYEFAESTYHRIKTRLSNNCNEKRHWNRVDRFVMIVCNNTSYIHQLLNNQAEQQDSLQRLISALMMIVDHKKLTIDQRQQTSYQEPQDDGLHCDESGNSMSQTNLHFEELLRTASQLILRKQCADAA